ncbi:hypothetical protein ACFL6F_03965 [Planctomycetota bacterium]
MKRYISGFMLIELVIAIAIFSLGVTTFSAVLFHQAKLTRSVYKNIAVIQALEGELIKLQSGKWKAYPRNKEIAYKPDPSSWKDYPKGDFILKIEDSEEYKHTVMIILQWKPAPDYTCPEKILTGYAYKGEEHE